MAIEWIPVSERLPDDESTKIVYLARLNVYLFAYLSAEVGEWVEASKDYVLESVTHWAAINPPTSN